jgi:hypothetical protein
MRDGRRIYRRARSISQLSEVTGVSTTAPVNITPRRMVVTPGRLTGL